MLSVSGVIAVTLPDADIVMLSSGRVDKLSKNYVSVRSIFRQMHVKLREWE